MKNTTRGFTLIELLVVIAIIGILASIVLVSVNNFRDKASNIKILAETKQIGSALEQGYAGGAYSDLEGSATNVDGLAASGPSLGNLIILLCSIGQQNDYPTTVTDDIVLDCDGTPDQHTGVVIYSTGTDLDVRDFGIYATTSPGGYVCVDSAGSTITSTSSIPAYEDIASPATALCQ